MMKRNNLCFDMMVAPGVLLLLVFSYLPMAGLIIAFKDYTYASGILGSKWVGFDNFITFFHDPFFTRVIKNTFILGIGTLVFTFPMPIILALLLNEVRLDKFKRISQTITYMPYFVSTVIIVGIMQAFLNYDGVINSVIQSLGLDTINFFNEPNWFRPIYIISIIWQNTGFNAIIYLAAISGIDQQIYEAANIDGAGRLQIIYRVTLPAITPTILILLILAVAGIVGNDFERIYLMYSPLTYDTADVISTYVYRSGIGNARFGFATAIGLFNSIIAVMLLTISNTLSRKISEKSLW